MSILSRRAAPAALLVVSAAFIPRPAAAQPQITAKLDSVMNSLMAMELSPGAGIVVVQGDKVIYMKGFGYADLESKRPFTPETEFYIASTTKSFTGLAAALLDRKGTFKLDAPLHQYLPSLHLKPPLNADSITIRSLLAHTHGIGNSGPMVMRLAYTGEYNGDADLIKFLEMHDAARDGRTFRYGNVGYNVAALAMDAVTKKNWKEVLQSEIFSPLGMKHTSAYVSKFERADLATPYQLTLDGWKARPYGKTDANMQSAGGLITTLRDMGTWLTAHINNGKVGGRQVLPAAAFEEAHKNAAGTLALQAMGGTQIGYALGWNILVRGNDTIYTHGGGFPGFATHMSFVPSRRLGMVIFANNDGLGSGIAEVGSALVYAALTDNALPLPIPADRVPALIAREKENINNDLKRRAARPQTLPFPLDAYTGVYENPLFGKLKLSAVNGKLEANLGAAWSAVEVFDNTKNQLRMALFGDGEVVNVEMKDGKAVLLAIGGTQYTRVK